MHLADLNAYLEADGKPVELRADREGWARKGILGVASSGKFSSDRTIAEVRGRDLARGGVPVEWRRCR